MTEHRVHSQALAAQVKKRLRRADHTSSYRFDAVEQSPSRPWIARFCHCCFKSFTEQPFVENVHTRFNVCLCQIGQGADFVRCGFELDPGRCLDLVTLRNVEQICGARLQCEMLTATLLTCNQCDVLRKLFTGIPGQKDFGVLGKRQAFGTSAFVVREC